MKKNITNEVRDQIQLMFKNAIISTAESIANKEEGAIRIGLQIRTIGLKSNLLAFCERLSNAVVTINRYDEDHKWNSAISFVSGNTKSIDFARKLEIEISSLYDEFTVFEIKNNQKTLIYNSNE